MFSIEYRSKFCNWRMLLELPAADWERCARSLTRKSKRKSHILRV